MHINVLTYNIRGGMWAPANSSSLAEILKKYEVDVACLQEVVQTYNDPEEHTTKRDVVDEILKPLSGTYRAMRFLPVQSPSKSGGNAILFRKDVLHPVGAEYGKAFPKISQRSRLEEIASKFMLPERRVAMSGKFNFDGRTLIVYNVHLDYFGGDTRRMYQIQHFFNLWGTARQQRNVVEIMAGDFNTWSPVKFHRIYRKISILGRFLRRGGFREATEDVEWTHIFDRAEADRAMEKGVVDYSFLERMLSRSNSTFKQKLDHVWVRGDAQPVSVERLDVRMSDHYPVLVKLAVPDIAQ